MKYYHLPGHAPGHVLYLHVPSGIIPGGDIVARIDPTFAFLPTTLPPPFFNQNETLVKEAVAKVACLDFKSHYPTHDCDNGITRQQLKAFAAYKQIPVAC